jgi:CheY-like chemotaxis protein
MTGFMLTALGCDVYTCENGIDAIAATQEQQFDLILLDYILPKISGHELLEKIKEINGEVKIVVMSGYGSNISEELASEVMQKPFDLDMLANKLNQALGQTVH